MDAKTRRRVLMQGDAVPEGWAVHELSNGRWAYVFINSYGLKYFYATSYVLFSSAFHGAYAPADIFMRGFETTAWSGEGGVERATSYVNRVSLESEDVIRLIGENFGNMTNEEIIAYGKSLKMIYKL